VRSSDEPVRCSDEFDNAFTAMMRERPDAFLMTNDPFHQLSVGRIIDFLANNRLPGMLVTREVAVAGGLLSDGASLPDLFRRGAVYVHKILQGTRWRICRSSSRSCGTDLPEHFRRTASLYITATEER